MNERIEDNASNKKIKRDIDAVDAISSLADLFSIFFPNSKEIKTTLEPFKDIKAQFELISKSPDKFNAFFGKRGWIAHESMNHNLMLTCIQFAEKNRIDLAEQELINYYSSEEMKWLTYQLKGTDAFLKRYSLIQGAYEDTISERYYACIPVLLLVIDGAVNDISKSKGFFAENTDLTAWDSIAAHSTGLSALKEIFNDTRKRTTEEEITMPYRHGILHGRDINYANKIVAAKCWAALFAIKDWAAAIKDGKKESPCEEPEKSLKESMTELKETLDNYAENHKKNEETMLRIEKWSARNLRIGVDVSPRDPSSSYPEFSPERSAILFAENWENENYGGIAKQIHHLTKSEINVGKEAGKIRKIFQNKYLSDYKIINIKDCSPAITEVSLEVIVIYQGNEHKLEIKLRLIYEGVNGETLIFGDKGGTWKFVESFFFHKIEYLD